MKVYDLNLSEEQQDKLKLEMDERKTGLGQCLVCNVVLEIRDMRKPQLCFKHQSQARYVSSGRYTSWSKGSLTPAEKDKILREGSR